MTWICNAFSLQMLVQDDAVVKTKSVDKDFVKALPSLESAIGHADTAAVVSHDLEREVPQNRANIKLAEGEFLIVAQFSGGRLPEGATKLPEGTTLKYLKVQVAYPEE